MTRHSVRWYAAFPQSGKSCLLAGLFALLAAPALAANPDRGQQLYGTHCANCHGERGVPIWPGTPDFKRSASLMRPDGQLLAVIRRGKGVMPAYAGVIRDREMLDLLAYLRTMN